ncbi:MAG: hypothetical protein EA377_08835 [Phycisphaerales bacterium]|nr:MAG: hypothetical protein EA377_08835 [Phycisphaerales bacterium]
MVVIDEIVRSEGGVIVRSVGRQREGHRRPDRGSKGDFRCRFLQFRYIFNIIWPADHYIQVPAQKQRSRTKSV